MLAVSLPVAAGGAAALALWYRSATRRFVEGAQTLHELVAAPVPQHLVFRDVATWDGLSNHVRRHTSVEVQDGRVVAVREAGDALRAGAVVVDGEGKTLIPGLIDMHVHMMYESEPDLLTRAPALMRGWMDIVTRYPEGRGDIVRRGQLKLKAGVTTIRILGDGYYALAYRDDVAAWDVVGPRVYAAGLHVNAPDGYVTGEIAAGLEPSLCWALLRTRLVPRSLAILGLVGYPVLLAAAVLDMLGQIDTTRGGGVLAFVPGGLFEILLQLWLFTKGFASSGHRSRPERHPPKRRSRPQVLANGATR